MCIFNNMHFGPPDAWSCAFIPACPLTSTEPAEADGTRDPLKAPWRTKAEEPGLNPKTGFPGLAHGSYAAAVDGHYHRSIPRDWGWEDERWRRGKESLDGCSAPGSCLRENPNVL